MTSPAQYREAWRALQAEPPVTLRPVKLALLATFTASPLASYIGVEAAARGLYVTSWTGPYDQIEQQALHSGSELYAQQPDVIVIAARLQDWASRLWQRFASLSPIEREREWRGAVERLDNAIAAIRRHSKASILLCNFIAPLREPAGLAGAMLQPSPAQVLQEANHALAQLCLKHAGVFLFDAARLATEVGLNAWHDPKLAYVARLPFSVAAQIAIGKRLARHLRALFCSPCKVLVTDLDNTLWGGVLGEAGPGGLQLGEDYPGSVFSDFQRALLGLRDRGILLAIASRNNLEEVREAWPKLRCPLAWDDFAASEIHWDDKATSLRNIARKLSLGVDALAFYDDDPLQREWVRSQLPQVTVIDVPDDLLQRIPALDDSGAFDQLMLSQEDQARAASYQQARQREEAQQAAGTLEDFLASLQLEIDIAPVTPATLPRVAQLINKTNQFNLTAIRETQAELQAHLDNGAIAATATVRDRFGDYGLVAAAMAVSEAPGTYRIRHFVVSCRALGRGVEQALLTGLLQHLKAACAHTVTGEWKPTGRNDVARDFYAQQGWQAKGDGLLEWQAYL
ncbi:MAG: HAD-IIIC family phosphatase [Bryobacterales bacterium]|nr:HAD-IIIC family phosphatase [Bryobacterales bacterium]